MKYHIQNETLANDININSKSDGELTEINGIDINILINRIN
jgi:hypothetical protein